MQTPRTYFWNPPGTMTRLLAASHCSSVSYGTRTLKFWPLQICPAAVGPMQPSMMRRR